MIIHGETIGGNSRLYGVWKDMIRRTTKSNNKRYKDYGGRGITVCDEWRIAGNFIAWARSHGYQDDLLLDRKDNDKGYYPENCQFLNRSNSQINRRKSPNHGIYKMDKNNTRYFYIQITRHNHVYTGGCTQDINVAKQLRDELEYKLDSE